MTRRVRTRRSDGPVSARVYWRLYRLSPLIMIVGLVAGTVLVVRPILIWAIPSSGQSFGIDIPLSVAALAAWGYAAALLLLPPRSVLARRDGMNATTVLVWSLGRRFRFWNMICVPLSGILPILGLLAIAVALGADPQIPANLWFGLPFAVGLEALSVLLAWIVIRSAWHGVQLTPTHLVARGFLATRRYGRADIVSVNAVPLKWWAQYLLRLLTGREVDCSLQLSLMDGREPVLYASNSGAVDVEVGAEIVRTWRLGIEERSRR